MRLLLVCLSAAPSAASDAADWWNADWKCRQRVFLDASLLDEGLENFPLSLFFAPSDEMRIGRGVLHFDPWQFHGDIDEVRVSAIARPESWLRAEAACLAGNGAFAVMGAPQMQGAPAPPPGPFALVGPDDGALCRSRSGIDTVGWIGVSAPPYTQWNWKQTDYRLGGPNFIQTPDGRFWAGTRYYGNETGLAFCRMTLERLETALLLPSGGDCSYPGMVWHDGLLWMSYYSSHEGKSNIYLAKLRLP